MSQSGFDKFIGHSIGQRLIRSIECLFAKRDSLAILLNELATLFTHPYVQSAHKFLPDG